MLTNDTESPSVTDDVGELLVKNVTDCVVFDADVFDVIVIGVVFGKLSCSVIVAVEHGAGRHGEFEPIQEFTKEDDFLAGVV